ncbi:tRNA (guanosine(46)-N7)-methyltransferase TrmB [Natronospirillum operosum]|uniref:tRNA (guanine-N(7)-)-methyltransferase n=1 Tax=Natronospirillum operosum TaxID=2759953 RepID=A0A4Z0W165_9GAMM|nr:tRNA (guanosine(46)-N7)-methyltransferase TrmB [Natronospirillum operosum]TGG90075.1 tRNA (guanosine(46)-N7)-methyltransferase TrmB [Natronospirillum operosum]
MSDSMSRPQRRIRSFVMRTGRMTPGQQRALSEQWPRLGLEADGQPLDLNAIFQRTAPVTLEIGFGMGDSLLTMAEQAPERDFIGIEVHLPGVGRLINRAHEAGVTNLRVMKDDAVEILQRQIGDGTLDRVQIFFPDPWHKKRHHKRRLIQPEFVALLARKLQPGGWLHLATDWENYAEHMLEVMAQSPDFRNTAPDGGYQPGRPAFRPLTKFEQRGERLGHGVWDLIFERVTTPQPD